MITLLGYKVDDSGRQQYNKDIDQTKQKQQSLTASFLKANIIMGVAQKAVGAAFSFVRDSMIGATAETERYRVALGTMMGDQEKANKIIRDLDYGEGMFEGVRLSDFYGTANAIGGLQNMVTFGMKAEEAGDVLARLGDIAQGDTESFVSMSNAMGQVFAKGKADSVNLKQFATKGFDVVGEVAKQTGRSREEIQKTGVTYEQTAAALRALTSEGGKYHGMLNKQMNTLGGIIKQFQSLKAAIAEAVGFGINEELKEILKYILQLARAGQDVFVGKFVKFLKEVIHWIFQVIIMWEVLGYRLEDMGAFEVLGAFFQDLRELAGHVLTGIMNLVVSLGKVFIQAFKTAYAFIKPILSALGPFIEKIFSFASVGVEGLIPIIKMLEPPLKVIGSVLGVIITGLGGIIDFLKPLAPIIVGIIAIIKIWTIVQWLLNAAMTANPIMLIVVAVIAAVALIVGLVMVVIKNWEKIADFFVGIWEGVKNIFSAAWEGIKNIFSAVGSFFSGVWNGIKNTASKAWEGVKNVTNKAWEGIKEGATKTGGFLKDNWKTIAIGMINPWAGGLKALYDHNEKFRNLVDKSWAKIKDIAGAVWDSMPDGVKVVFIKIKNIINSAIEKIKSVINGFKKFFLGLWEAMKLGPKATFEYLKNSFFGLMNHIKNGLENIKSFFVGIWEGVKEITASIWDGIKDIFIGVVNSIKNIWNGIKSFFVGLWEALKLGPTEAIEYIKNSFLGLFNLLQEKLLGFINKIKEAWNGVKNFFGGVMEGVGNFFTGGGKQPQPAYAGSSQAAVANKVGQTSSYAYNNATGGNSTVNAQTSINVNVPPGTPQAQSEAIARQIDAQFNAKLSSQINSSRANIPNTEVKRH